MPERESAAWLLCRVDMGMQEEVAACMEAAGSRGRLGGILHVSGILHDALIGQQSPALVREVYAPKVAGGKAVMQVGACVCPASRSRSGNILCFLNPGFLPLDVVAS